MLTVICSKADGNGRLRDLESVPLGGVIQTFTSVSLHLIKSDTRDCAHGRQRFSWTLQLAAREEPYQPIPHDARPEARQALEIAESPQKTSTRNDGGRVVTAAGTALAEAEKEGPSWPSHLGQAEHG